MSNWISFSPSSGSGNGQITITAQTLSELEDRVLTLVASGSQYSQILTASTVVTQKSTPPTAITFDSLSVEWVSDIPASGGTATKDNCVYKVYANYSDGTQVDVTNVSEVSGSLVVTATTADTRQEVGQLQLTAEFDGERATTSVDVYQSGKKISYISIDYLTWENDIPASGGIATSANCNYFVFAVYDNGEDFIITNDAVVSGSLVVPLSLEWDRHSAGTLTLTATYSGYSASANVTVYQAAPIVVDLQFEDVSWIYDIPEIGGVASESNCSYKLKAFYNNNATKYIVNTYDNIRYSPSYTSSNAFYVQSNTNQPRHSVGTLSLIGVHSGYTATTAVTAYQEMADVMVEPEKKYVTFEISESGYLNWIASGSANAGRIIYYSKDNGANWTSVASTTGGSIICYVDSGDTVIFKANGVENNSFSGSTAKFSVFGNILSLSYGDNFYEHYYDSFSGDTRRGQFAELFKDTNVISARHLKLPPNGNSWDLYARMFKDCSLLVKAPELPSTTVENRCYQGMFADCHSLTTTPILPASILDIECYDSMFLHCPSIRNIVCLATDISAYNCMQYFITDINTLVGTPANGNCVRKSSSVAPVGPSRDSINSRGNAYDYNYKGYWVYYSIE